MQNNYRVFILLMWSGLFFSCKQGEKTKEEAATPGEVETPVTVTGISTEPLAEYIELNASSSFLQKNYIKANANGYLQSNFTQPGQYVNRGQVLFTIKTKEAQSIGNAVNQLDSSFRFSGTNAIKAGGKGFITQLNHQAGDYVQDGEQLAVISDLNSFAFLLDLPYELRPYMQNKKTVELMLPDGEKLTGTVSGSLPSVDPASQTQSIFIKVNAGHPIPENLIAKVRITKSLKNNSVSLPKASVLTDETQSECWIMKMIDSNTAVKVVVTKGIETAERIEILSPPLSARDKILLTGNYGLADTAKVKIIQ
ncbi:MAG TPA: efflux RND transporter periplasmic adaptor subunit [Chitinophagaceae bacterium]|nr:efflux RND transporter periplasmic adaptor subunit [Chitinophagaceae bacterium]